jgi:predicted membrane protein
MVCTFIFAAQFYLFIHINFSIMSTENRSRTLLFALIVIAAGVLLLLRSAGLLPGGISRILLTWQMLLIVIGVFNIFSTQHKVSGYILLGIGGFFMINKFYYLNVSFWQVFWPLVLIGIGVAILMNYRRNLSDGFRFSHEGERISDRPDSDADTIDEVTVFSGTEKTITSKNFRGGKITSIFGGSEINMTRANLSPGKNDIEVVSIFGGSTLIVPPDWDIKVDVTAVFGGFSDKRYKRPDLSSDPEKILVVHGVVIFGGGEIKSY